MNLPYIVYCTVLYCTVLYCTVLYCTVLYCTVLYCTVLYCTVLYCTVLYCTVLYCTVLYCTVLYCTVLCTCVPVWVVSGFALLPLLYHQCSLCLSVGVCGTSPSPQGLNAPALFYASSPWQGMVWLAPLCYDGCSYRSINAGLRGLWE